MWEALGLLLLVLWQEQGGGWAQICSPADAAGCHTQRAHTRSPLTQTLHKYRHRVALILHTQMPNTSRTLFLCRQREHSVPVETQHQPTACNRQQPDLGKVFKNMQCDALSVLWGYLASLGRWGRCCLPREFAVWWRSRFCRRRGPKKQTKHKYFGNLWQSWQFMFSANPDLHSDFQTFFFSVNWETLKIILIVVETPQAK